MKNKFKNVGLNKIMEIVLEVLTDNDTKSVNIASTSFVGIEHSNKKYLAKYDWIFYYENEQHEIQLMFKELVLENLKELIRDGNLTDVSIRREPDKIIIKCSTKSKIGFPISETTIQCNNYIINTLIHTLIEEMYLKDPDVALDKRNSLTETILSVYSSNTRNYENCIELIFESKDSICIKKINVLYNKYSN